MATYVPFFLFSYCFFFQLRRPQLSPDNMVEANELNISRVSRENLGTFVSVCNCLFSVYVCSYFFSDCPFSSPTLLSTQLNCFFVRLQLLSVEQLQDSTSALPTTAFLRQRSRESTSS